MSVNDKIISNPSALQIGFSVCGILFFSAFAFLIFESEWITNDKTDVIAIWIFFALFILFSLACLYMLLCSKKIELTNDYLLITYPFLFYSKNIEFDDIKKVSESNYNVKSSHDFRTIEVYNGKKIIIEMFESKNITITSFEITNYKLLAQNLKNITKSYYKLNTTNQNLKSNEGYGWLIFLIILTSGLIVAIIQKTQS